MGGGRGSSSRTEGAPCAGETEHGESICEIWVGRQVAYSIRQQLAQYGFGRYFREVMRALATLFIYYLIY